MTVYIMWLVVSEVLACVM